VRVGSGDWLDFHFLAFASLLLLQNSVNLLHQTPNSILCNVLNQFVVYTEVIVDQSIAHSGHIFPLYIRIFRS